MHTTMYKIDTKIIINVVNTEIDEHIYAYKIQSIKDIAQNSHCNFTSCNNWYCVMKPYSTEFLINGKLALFQLPDFKSHAYFYLVY